MVSLALMTRYETAPGLLDFELVRDGRVWRWHGGEIAKIPDHFFDTVKDAEYIDALPVELKWLEFDANEGMWYVEKVAEK